MNIRTSFVFPSLLVIAAATSGGCMLAAMQERNRAIEDMNAQAVANGEAAQDQARTEMYVIEEAAWFCPEAEAARAGEACPEGARFDQGMQVRVIGRGPEDGVWRAETFDQDGQHLGYIRADAVNELPDTSEIDDFHADVDRAIPDSKRIPGRALSYMDFLEQPRAYRGRALVMRISNSDMRNLQVENGGLTFTMLVPVEPGSRKLAPVQFEMDDREWARGFKSGRRSYSCGAGYCDNFVVVARLTGKQAKRVDEAGNLKVLPVFRIDAMADRFGRYGSL